MQYQAIITKENDYWLIEFPNCHGCQTFTDDEAKIVSTAKEALEGWLEACLLTDTAPPKPSCIENAISIYINQSLSERIKNRINNYEKNT